jgi:hypothetical protein
VTLFSPNLSCVASRRNGYSALHHALNGPRSCATSVRNARLVQFSPSNTLFTVGICVQNDPSASKHRNDATTFEMAVVFGSHELFEIVYHVIVRIDIVKPALS